MVHLKKKFFKYIFCFFGVQCSIDFSYDNFVFLH